MIPLTIQVHSLGGRPGLRSVGQKMLMARTFFQEPALDICIL
jgi:hypothetical protein